MDIEELREKAIEEFIIIIGHYAINFEVDGRYGEEPYAEEAFDKFLSLPVIEERECPECGGEGNGKPTLPDPDGKPGGCFTCHGTGKLDPTTVGEWLALASPEALDIIKKG